jgi:DNA-binding response OmpR family regulator
VGEVDTVSTAEIPEKPADQFSGVVVDINLRSPESVQRVRNKLRGEAYRSMPRLFVLADALHHAAMQAWALGATDTITRPFRPTDILQRIRNAFPDTENYDATDRGKTLNRGIEAAHAVIRRMFQRLPSGSPLTFEDLLEAENKILKAIKHSSLPDPRRALARRRQGLHSGRDTGQARKTHGRGNSRYPRASAPRL